MTYGEKLLRANGVSCHIGRTDEDNANVIKTILYQYLAGASLLMTERCEDNWVPVDGLPTNFSDYRYRTDCLCWNLGDEPYTPRNYATT